MKKPEREALISHLQADDELRYEIARRDLWFFLTNYVYTYDPHYSEPSRRYPDKEYLEFIVNLWLKEPLLLIPKSRQMLLTWTVVACYYWDTAFHKGRFTFFQSKKEDDAGYAIEKLSLLNRAKFIHEHLPDGFRPEIKEVRRPPQMIFPKMDSTIYAIAQGPDVIRQYTATGILSDEMGFQERTKEAYTAAKPTIDGGGRFTGISSANGKEFFYRLMKDKEGV